MAAAGANPVPREQMFPYPQEGFNMENYPVGYIGFHAGTAAPICGELGRIGDYQEFITAGWRVEFD